MTEKMTVNFRFAKDFVEKFDSAWSKLGYRTRTEFVSEKMREAIEKAKEA